MLKVQNNTSNGAGKLSGWQLDEMTLVVSMQLTCMRALLTILQQGSKKKHGLQLVLGQVALKLCLPCESFSLLFYYSVGCPLARGNGKLLAQKENLLVRHHGMTLFPSPTLNFSSS